MNIRVYCTLFLLSFLLINSYNTSADATYSAVVESSTFYHTTIYLKIYYNSACADTPVNFSIYYWNNSGWEWHNTCYAYNKNEPVWPGGVACQFKFPLPIGSTTKAMVRAYQVNATDCSYTDYHNDTILEGVSSYSPYGDYNSTITGDKAYYKIKLSRNGGAVYEFYNKRGDPLDNTVHMHMGAALQIAIHSGAINSLTESPCGGAGYWNPTQAGAACSYKNGVTGGIESPIAGTNLDVYCDNVKNNSCTSVNNSVFFPQYPMMNWDYGTGYEGPYNLNDTSLMEENISLQDSYAQFDLKLRNNGTLRRGLIEIPTYYFTNKYRRCYYFSDSGLETINVPLNLAGLADASYHSSLSNNSRNFVTCENPDTPNSSITVAWFSSGADFSNVSNGLSETEYYKEIKFNKVQSFTYKNAVYALRYLIIPFKYDELIDTELGRMTVEDFINLKQPNYAPEGYLIEKCSVNATENLAEFEDGVDLRLAVYCHNYNKTVPVLNYAWTIPPDGVSMTDDINYWDVYDDGDGVNGYCDAHFSLSDIENWTKCGLMNIKWYGWTNSGANPSITVYTYIAATRSYGSLGTVNRSNNTVSYESLSLSGIDKNRVDSILFRVQQGFFSNLANSSNMQRTHLFSIYLTASATTTPTTTSTQPTTTTTTTTSGSTTTTASATTTTTQSGGTTTSTTTTTLPGECVMTGNNEPCNVVSLSEIIAAIDKWVGDEYVLSDVINLINSWADSVNHPPN